MRQWSTVMGMAMAMALLGGCGAQPGTHGGLNTGNGLTTAALQLGLASSVAAPAAIPGSAQQGLTQAPSGTDAQGTAFTLASASIAVRQIDMDLVSGVPFTAEQQAGVSANVSLVDDDVTVRGPFEVDLFTQKTTPSLGAVVVPSGAYNDVRVHIAPFEGADLEHAFEATGSFAYRGSPTPFTLAIDFDNDARFTAPDGLQLVSGQAAQVALSLDVAKWFSALPITDCLDSGDLKITQGSLAIQSGTGDCADLEDTLKAAIEGSGKLSAIP